MKKGTNSTFRRLTSFGMFDRLTATCDREVGARCLAIRCGLGVSCFHATPYGFWSRCWQPGICSPAGSHVNHDSDDRESHAIAYHWASRVMTICLEMVVPGVLGYLADQKLGTRFVFTLIGFSVGLVLGVVHLLRITDKTAAGGSKSTAEKEQER